MSRMSENKIIHIERSDTSNEAYGVLSYICVECLLFFCCFWINFHSDPFECSKADSFKNVFICFSASQVLDYNGFRVIIVQGVVEISTLHFLVDLPVLYLKQKRVVFASTPMCILPLIDP